MYYLVDTNIFLWAIKEKIYDVANDCKKINKDIVITSTILNELEPGNDKSKEDPSLRDVYVQVNNLVTGGMGAKLITKVDISTIPKAKAEYQKIRNRFYSWMGDADYLKQLIDNNKLTEKEIKSSTFRNKDKGECELIALAIADPENYNMIVSDDKGRVYVHPEQNLFDDYAVQNGVNVIVSKQWLETIKKEILAVS